MPMRPRSRFNSFKRSTIARAVVAPRLAHVGGPILHRRPARRRRSRDRSHVAFERKNRREIRLAAAAVGQITGVGLIIGRMASVLRRDNDVEILLAHQLAHRLPTPVALGDRETRIRIKLSHGKISDRHVNYHQKDGEARKRIRVDHMIFAAPQCESRARGTRQKRFLTECLPRAIAEKESEMIPSLMIVQSTRQSFSSRRLYDQVSVTSRAARNLWSARIRHG